LRLVAEGYYKAASMLGLWHHKWHPVQCCLIIANLGIKNIGIEHFNHLLDLLKKYHGVQVNMMGDKLVGMDIKWDYSTKCCCISMPGYIDNLLLNSNTLALTNYALSPQMPPYLLRCQNTAST
jgi:hypothetical protein